MIIDVPPFQLDTPGISIQPHPEGEPRNMYPEGEPRNMYWYHVLLFTPCTTSDMYNSYEETAFSYMTLGIYRENSLSWAATFGLDSVFKSGLSSVLPFLLYPCECRLLTFLLLLSAKINKYLVPKWFAISKKMKK